MTDNITNAAIKDIVKTVISDFDPNNTTAGGHSKFAKFSKNGVEMRWKENKELHVEVAGVKLPVSKIDTEELQALIDNMPIVSKIASGFPQIVVKKKTSRSRSFD